jgi:GTPase
MLAPEVEEGNVEYKRYLINLDSNRFEQLSTQMKWRLAEGNNEAIYYLGVDDNGTPYNMTKNETKETLFNFTKLVNSNKAEIINFEKNNYQETTYFKITIRKKHNVFPEVRVVLLGDTGTGKTTFLSNILLNKTDNNDARIYLMNHKHELVTKKTSSFNCHYKNYSNHKFSFMEAPGYKEYQRTKYKILLGSKPNICLLFTNSDGKVNQFDLFIVKTLNIPYQTVNVFDSTSIYNCKKLIDKKIFFDLLIGIKQSHDYDNKTTKFNILNIYPHSDLGIIMSGYLVSGCLEINKPIYWITKSNILDCKIKSIHINCEPVNKCDTSNMLTVCVKPNKNSPHTPIVNKLKSGVLSNKVLSQKTQISFHFLNFSGEKVLNNMTGYLANRLVNLTNIKQIDGNEYLAQIDNYYNDGKTIIIDMDNIKGIILIKH